MTRDITTIQNNAPSKFRFIFKLIFGCMVMRNRYKSTRVSSTRKHEHANKNARAHEHKNRAAVDRNLLRTVLQVIQHCSDATHRSIETEARQYSIKLCSFVDAALLSAPPSFAGHNNKLYTTRPSDRPVGGGGGAPASERLLVKAVTRLGWTATRCEVFPKMAASGAAVVAFSSTRARAFASSVKG